MNLIDTHCHLVSPSLAPRIGELLNNASHAGVSRILNIGYNLESSRLACDQLSLSNMLYAAVGIQPHDASTFSEDALVEINHMAQNHARVVAIGELGLDAFHNLSPMNIQISCFRRFLEVAETRNLPVIVHMRNTFDEVRNSITPFASRGLTGVIHCFTGDVTQARAFLDLGFYISFSGIITFKNPSEFDEVVRFIPSNRILCETDSPYLAPKPNRGKTNEPAWVRHTCEHIARIRGESFEKTALDTTQNALSLFKRMSNV